ncbi:MAG: phosphorylated adapter RNA export RNA-binding domain-containing protein [Chloroflexota bacterium]
MSQATKKDTQAVIKEIADTLGESERKPLKQIENIVKLCGVLFAQKVLEDTLEIEANGGMMVSTGDRRRTPGGVFFYLARERMDDDVRQEIFFAWRVAAQRRVEQEAQYPEFEWEERSAIVAGQQDGNSRGKVSEVKISLIGRPGEVERRQDLVITTMRDEMSDDLVMPRGVPHPSPLSQEYTVYISSRQWERVEKAIEHPDDELIVEGLAGFDDATNALAVFTTYVTTRRLQKKEKRGSKKQPPAQQPNQQEKRQQRPQKSATRPVKQSRKEASTQRERPFQPAELAPPPEPEINIDIPEGMPADAAKKFVDLHKAAATFRQKIAMIEARPSDQQFGLEMTQKLLTSTEKQIDMLEKQYSKDN